MFGLLGHGGRSLRGGGGFSPTQEGRMSDVQCVDGEEDHAVISFDVSSLHGTATPPHGKKKTMGITDRTTYTPSSTMKMRSFSIRSPSQPSLSSMTR